MLATAGACAVRGSSMDVRGGARGRRRWLESGCESVTTGSELVAMEEEVAVLVVEMEVLEEETPAG